MAEPTLLSRFQGCLMGVRLGDAMGMPWETMTRKQILKKTDGQGVTGFVDPQQRSSPDTAHLKAGDTTDDWQLTEAVAESLIRKRGFDYEDMAYAHVQAYKNSIAGWGGTTKTAMEEFDLWSTSNGRLGRNPREPSTIFSRGNGVAMKIAPLALVMGVRYRNDSEYLLEEVLQLGRMTHGDPLASTTAHALAHAISDGFRKGASLTPDDAEFFQIIERNNESGSRLISHAFSSRMTLLCADREALKRASIEDVLLVTGAGFDAVESVSVALACAMRHLDDPRAGLLEAISCGGDTDTVASMCGAILGARNGIEGWPPEWVGFRPEYDSTFDLGRRLLEAAQAESFPS